LLVRRLQLTNFRNYHSLDLSLDGGYHLFAGDNAQGKSNLLEAVYMLAAARSVRAGADSELIGWPRDEGLASESPQPFARLQARVERAHDGVDLEVLVVGAGGPAGAGRAGKRLRVNGIPRRTIDLVGQLRAVIFTADDLEIVSGGPSERRTFIDAAITQLDRRYYGALQRYGRLLQQRNASLRRVKEGIGSVEEVTLWDAGFAREGAVIVAARQNAVARLAELAGIAHAELSGDARESLALRYEPRLGDEWQGLLPAEATPEAVEPLFAAALAGGRRRDLAAGLSLVGPHRDDLVISLNGVSAAAFASRAQMRTAALALRLAEARLLAEAGNDPPVLLLDDLFSELDPKRRRSVIDGIAHFDQVWLTATDLTSLPEDFLRDCSLYRVEAGNVGTVTD
jgi:DNA replication and repair protein RecF